MKGSFEESSVVRIISLASAVPEAGKMALTSGWGRVVEASELMMLMTCSTREF